MKITIRENKSSRKLILAKINPNKLFANVYENLIREDGKIVIIRSLSPIYYPGVVRMLSKPLPLPLYGCPNFFTIKFFIDPETLTHTGNTYSHKRRNTQYTKKDKDTKMRVSQNFPSPHPPSPGFSDPPPGVNQKSFVNAPKENSYF